MTALILASIINVSLDALFLFVFNWGMFGAGLATGIAQLLGLIMVIFALRRTSLLHSLRPRFASPLRLMGKGLASLIMELSQGIVILVFNFALLSLAGEVGVSSYAIIANLSLMFTAVFLGLAQGAQPLFGRARGANDPEKFQFVLTFAQQVGFALSVGVVLICLLFPQILAGVFISNDPEVLELTLRGLRFYSLGFIFLGYNLVGTLALQSSKRALEAFIFALARGMGFLILFMLMLQGMIGVDGVWLSFLAAEMTGFFWMRYSLNRPEMTPSGYLSTDSSLSK